jgi:hypothetical protein
VTGSGTAYPSWRFPTLSDYIIGNDAEVVLGPPQAFTADNIGEFNF